MTTRLSTDTSTTSQAPVRLPDGPRFSPRAQIRFVTDRPRSLAELAERYGPTFTMPLLSFGRTVVITEPTMFDELFHVPSDVAGGIEPSLDVMFGSGSIFGKQTSEHRRDRKLLTPPPHRSTVAAFGTSSRSRRRRPARRSPPGRSGSSFRRTRRR
ncbi:cytochrome P450 [Gordonia malaquae]|uniref:cytochrome P450 n=1 Tax=Gordonia malaquae TaxID=410332 RepID=UPI00034A0A02|nr:cytochrome P450 [Gordonia malaquae]